MGTVFLAEQREPVRRRVALKVIRFGLDSREVLARFHAERQALALMEHDNIARVYDAGASDDGRPYFVMEYVVGSPITRYCEERRLPLRARISLFRQVCAGIQHAHQKGILHRDLKPSNVLVTEQGGQAVAKIIDFGLARATNLRLVEQTLFTEHGQILGTPEYMSPEQAGFGGQDIDTRTDVYSLGVLLYELLSGRLPFEPTELRQAGLLEMQRIIREVEPPTPSCRVSQVARTAVGEEHVNDPATARDLRGDLDWIVMKTLEKDRARRYATADGLASDLGRYLDDEPVEAGPPSGVYRVRKFLRRHRGPVAAAVVLLLTLLAGIAGTLNGLENADRLRTVAERKAREAEASKSKAETATRELETALRAAKQGAYLARIAAAATAVRDEEFGDAERLLRATLPDVRGWEYDFLCACLERRRPMRVLVGHQQKVVDVSFSPDGTRILTASVDRTARVWSVVSGEAVAVLADHDGELRTAVFDAKGQRVLTATASEARVYELGTAAPPIRLRRRQEMRGARFGPDGRSVVTAHELDDTTDEQAHVWDLEARQVSASLDAHSVLLALSGQGPPRAILGQLLARSEAAGGERSAIQLLHGSIGIFDAAATRVALLDAQGRLGQIRCAAFDAEGLGLVTVGSDRTVRIWDTGASTGTRLLSTTPMGGIFPTGRCAVTLLGDRATVVATSGAELHVWDSAEPSRISRFEHSHQPITSLALDSTGQLVVTGHDDGSVRVWDATSGRRARLLTNSPVSSLTFSPEGSRLLVATPTSVDLWDCATGSRVMRFPGGVARSEGVGQRTAWRADGARLAIADGREVAIFDPWTGSLLITLRGHRGPIVDLSFDAGGQCVVSAAEDGTARLWNVEDGRSTVVEASATALAMAMFLPDEVHLLTASATGELKVWTRVGECVTTIASEGQDGGVLARNRLGLVARRSASGNVEVVDCVATSTKRPTILITGRVHQAGLDSRGTTFAAATEHLVRLWSLATALPMETLFGAGIGTGAIAFSPDGARLLAKSGNGAAQLWDVATGEPAIVLRESGHGVDAVCFSADGRRIATSSRNIVRLWDATAPDAHWRERLARRMAAAPANSLVAETLRSCGDFASAVAHIQTLPDIDRELERAALDRIQDECRRALDYADRLRTATGEAEAAAALDADPHLSAPSRALVRHFLASRPARR